ncbi:hypothetical protein [Azospirillum brasilense]|uniref:hypothetical protein n=1 Tax=Azospirillum brasilense TaxID=192 RepID=UPI0010C0EBBF|nr:hypothetical protein [Azospirillum brasilense]
MSATDLAAKSGLTPPKTNAVRQWCGIDGDAQCCRVFQHGSMKFPSYSDHALTKIEENGRGPRDQRDLGRAQGESS